MIVLINPFEVPAEASDEEFLAGWQRAADYLSTQPGFIRSKLHRAASPDARFRFINVAEWETPAAFRAAVSHPEFVKLRDETPFSHYPSLFEVVRT